MALLTDEDRRIAARTPIFGSLSADDLKALLDACPVVSAARGQMLFARGDEAAAMFLMLQGRVKLVQIDESGGEAVLRTFGSGETFGEAAAFLGGRYPVSAFAVEASRLLRIHTGMLKAGIRQRPELALAMLASMAAHLKALVQQNSDLKLMTADQRVAWFLVQKLRTADDERTVRFPYGRAVIASELGMTPETFSRALKRLVRIGVSTEGDRAEIADSEKLARYARPFSS